MSDNSTLNALAQEFIPQLPAGFAGRYAALCSAVLLIYDHSLTLSLEVRHIWHGKMNIMKALFILNRYISLIFLYGQVLLCFVKPATNTVQFVFPGFYPKLTEFVEVFYYIDAIFNSLTDFAIFCIFTLRTYAIYGRSKTVLFILVVPAVVNLSSGIWERVEQTAVAFPLELQIGPANCNFISPESLFTGLINIISAAIFDVLIVILTVSRTGRLALQSREAKISGSLSLILFRDGMLYYGAIFIPQSVLLVLYGIVLKTGSYNLDGVVSALNYISSSIQIVPINRLVLNLSHAANAHDDSEFRTRTGLEPLSFASGPVLGNIGGPVRSFPDEEWDDEVPEPEGLKMVDMERAGSEVAGPSTVNEREVLDGTVASSSLPVAGEITVGVV